MKAYGKNIRISPKKLLVIAEIIKWKKVTEALKFLKFAPKKWADLLYKLVYSAMKNAENNNAQKGEDLFIGELIISKGTVYKRWVAASRGRSHPIKKRTSNIRLDLQVK